MRQMPFQKYRQYQSIDMPDRAWPSKKIVSAPKWCSVDLRDGNQALVVPMTVAEKLELFNLLLDIGFKEIEVGFPAASQTEYEFLRMLIDKDLIPDDVTVQVLTQARKPLIKKTFEALQGVHKAVVHLYNSTSELQRRVVFGMDRSEITKLAVAGAELIREEAEKMSGSDIRYEYTPESFTGTEPEFAIRICEAVMDVWQPSAERKMILNLPATVEMSTPNTYADLIEWFCRHIRDREKTIISVHAHNDRGTAVAATELAVMAGAERVEGTLFGNGERTGNVDLVALAMNLFSQGIDPELNFCDMDRIITVCERCTKIPVHVRHPYAGELVYTAFSGSHQDAIKKGMKTFYKERPQYWEVPYLPVDPADVGRTYETVIRINSQSGKGGAAFVMENEYGFSLPKEMWPEFGIEVQKISDRTGGEVLPHMLWDAFENEYLKAERPFAIKDCRVSEGPCGDAADRSSCAEVRAILVTKAGEQIISGNGNGPIDAFSDALKSGTGINFRLVSYFEHALGKGSDSRAAAYIRIEDGSGKDFFGVGIDTNIDIASFRAILSAVNRSCKI